MKRILDADDIRRVVRRIAHELVERDDVSDLVIMGIRTRGVPLGQRLAAALADIEDTVVSGSVGAAGGDEPALVSGSVGAAGGDEPALVSGSLGAAGGDEPALVPAGSLDVTLYRDDLSRRGPLPLGRTEFPCDIDGRTVVLVDDVLYSGRTIRAAMEAVFEVGRPAAIRLAVLVDRGHRELPIRADHVGKNLPTATTEQVRVLLEELDGEDAVVIEGVTGGAADDRVAR